MNERAVCGTCFHHCRLLPGETGFCRGRGNRDGEIVPVNYGKFTAIALDPIEKKPFARFCPGSKILSVGSYGCSLRCPFCQNAEISQAGDGMIPVREIPPKELVNLALEIPDNLGLAFTYNEPLISWEYIRDAGKLLKSCDAGKKIAVVTNGMADLSVYREILPYVDAMNIDLKGDARFYREELMGDLEEVREAIAFAAPRCHVEVTVLVIPGKNDSVPWIGEAARWLASLDPAIVLHLSRYFPRWKYRIPMTPKETILRMQKEAEKVLPYVCTGNLW